MDIWSQEEKDRLWQRLRLVLIGGCRNAEDERRVADLRVSDVLVVTTQLPQKDPAYSDTGFSDTLQI